MYPPGFEVYITLGLQNTSSKGDTMSNDDLPPSFDAPESDAHQGPPPQPLPEPEPEKEVDLSDFRQLFNLVRSGKEDELKVAVAKHLQKLVLDHGVQDYLVIYLFDSERSIGSSHANDLYEAAAEGKKAKDILLIIQSDGGRIEPAYLASKTCKRLAKDRFLAVVPRRAKSAATLLALGADEIHMGLMSELGPIDPQIGGYPALGLTNALNKVAELAAKFPRSSDMWSKYLGAKLNLNDLGYFDRVTESAAQYAERLMRAKLLPEGKTATGTASHFVNHYKDHSFVIDYDEAISLLGTGTIKIDTKEYAFGNAVYGFLNLVELALSAFQDKDFALVGNETGWQTRKQEPSK